MEYKIFKPKAFESSDKVETRLNEMALQGWRVITNMNQGGYLVLGKGK